MRAMKKYYQINESQSIDKLNNLLSFFTLSLVSIHTDEFIRFCSPKRLKVLLPYLKYDSNLNDIPEAKLKKLFFIFLLSQRKGLFIREWELCTPYFARELEVTNQTVTNWINQLQRLGWLVCTDRKYCKAYKSRSYRIDKTEKNKTFVKMLNHFNGFYEKYPSIKKNELVQKYRKSAEKKIDKTCYKFKDCCPLAQSHLDDPKGYLEFFINRGNKNYNFSPRVQNPTEINLTSAVKAYNWIMKRNNRKSRITSDVLLVFGIKSLKFFTEYQDEFTQDQFKMLRSLKKQLEFNIEMAPSLRVVRNSTESLALIKLMTNESWFMDRVINNQRLNYTKNDSNDKWSFGRKFTVVRLPEEEYFKEAKNSYDKLPSNYKTKRNKLALLRSPRNFWKHRIMVDPFDFPFPTPPSKANVNWLRKNFPKHPALV